MDSAWQEMLDDGTSSVYQTGKAQDKRSNPYDLAHFSGPDMGWTPEVNVDPECWRGAWLDMQVPGFLSPAPFETSVEHDEYVSHTLLSEHAADMLVTT